MRLIRVSGNKTTRLPSNHLVFDCETRAKPKTKTLRAEVWRFACAIAWRHVAGHVTRETRQLCNAPGELHDFIAAHATEERPLWVWAHHALFDLQVARVWQYLYETGWTLKNVCMESPPFIARFVNGKRLIILVDTFNWVRKSLAGTAELIGMQKQTMPGRDAGRDEWEPYCWNDCAITQGVVCKILDTIDELDLGVFRPTLAGQTIQHWRHNQCPRGEPVRDSSGRLRERLHCLYHDDWNVKRWERAGYYAAGVRVYYVGKIGPKPAAIGETQPKSDGRTLLKPYGPVTVLDANSLYGAAAIATPLPVALLNHEYKPTAERLDELCKTFEVLAHVQVESRTYEYPTRKEGSVIFPSGRYWTWLPGPELRYALDHGDVVRCDVAALYQRGRPLDAYVNFWWEKRMKAQKAGDAWTDHIAKYMLACWHGKAAQRPSQWQIDPTLDPNDWWGSGVLLQAQTRHVFKTRTIAGVTDIELPMGCRCVPTCPVDRTGKSSCGKSVQDRLMALTFVSAWITSQARMMMHYYRLDAGKSDCVYQAVDALHVLPAGLRRLQLLHKIASDQLGALRVVKTYTKTHYRGWNYWEGDGEIHLAGLKARAVPQGDDWYEYEDWEGPASLLGRDQDGEYHVNTRAKHFETRYPKGAKRRAGWILPHSGEFDHDVGS